MSTKLATILADFTTTLATAMAVGATAVTLQSATDDDGNALPAGVYFFAIDGNNSQKEHIVCTLSGSSLTSISSISRQGVQTSGVVRSHRVGSTVTLTDFAHIKYINDLLKGTTDLDSTAPLKYDGVASVSANDKNLATVKYVNDTAVSGAPDSSATTKGISKMSVAPASPTSPIAVGDNDPRVPTAAQVGYIPTSGQKDALSSTTTPASTNLYTTQKDLQKGAEIYVLTTGSANAYVATYSPAPAALVAGMRLSFKANFANTGAATLNPNGLGATSIVKNGSVALVTNDILSGQIVEVEYDGTNLQMLSPASTAFRGVVGSGGANKNLADVSTTQNIAHGLGVVPRSYRLIASSTGSMANAIGSNALYYRAGDTNLNQFILTSDSGGVLTNYQVGTISADATNIIITWTKNGLPSGTGYIFWEAIA